MMYVLPFLISVAVNGGFFLLASRMKTDVFTDITYSLSFVLVALASFALRSGQVPEQVFALIFVVVWAVRLGSYLFRRIRKTGVDHRFDAMRESPVRFGMFWALQAITVWVLMLPFAALMANGELGGSMPLFERVALLLGTVLWIFGFIIEAVADKQKSDFKKDPANEGKFMKTGLWELSRHPNYFGEILVWWGIGILALPWMRGWSLLTMIGPVFITFLLVFVSGIPLVEKAWKEKYSGDPEFEEYMQNTRMLLPLKKRVK